MNWQPIETAPRDGTLIDLWLGTYRQCDCFWHLECERSDHAWYTMEEGGYWIGVLPTHWMPLPEPPQC